MDTPKSEVIQIIGLLTTIDAKTERAYKRFKMNDLLLLLRTLIYTKIKK